MRSALTVVGSVVLSGVLLAFALPPHGWSPLGWMIYVPILIAVRGRGFAIGFVAGLLSCVVAAWIDAQGFLLQKAAEDGTADWIYAGFILFGLVSSVVVGMWSASERLQKSPWVLAAWAVALEGLLLFYLPAHLALTQSRSTILLFLSSWMGIWGVSYMVWLVNFWVARDGLRRAWILAPAIICSLSFLPAETGDLRVGMVQTQSYELAALNHKASSKGAQICVWPELSAPPDVDAIAKQFGQCPFVSSREEPGNPKPFNVAHIFSAVGESNGYKKRKPFAGESQTHEAGSDPVSVLHVGIVYGLNICFDSCFPAIMRDTSRLPRVAVILLPTLDPNTSFGVVQSIHAAYTPFRAAELGLPIVRTDATGSSMAVDSYGRTIVEGGNQQDKVLIANVRPGKRWTLITITGDWFLWACFVVVSLTGKSRKPSTQDSNDSLRRP